MNHGAELLDPDPQLAQRLLSQGLQLEPKEAIGWFNLGIGLHQQRRIAGAVRAYRHCLTLPHNKETGKQHATTSRRICSCSADGRRDGITTPSVLAVNRETIHYSLALFGKAKRSLLIQSKPVLLMSEQGLETQCNSAGMHCIFNSKDFDVTLLSQPALVPLLRDAMVLNKWSPNLKSIAGQIDNQLVTSSRFTANFKISGTVGAF